MPRQRIYPNSINEAVVSILAYLEDTNNTVHKAIYFDGWSGLAASVVLRSIAENPPSSLLSKFNKIIHIDCSRWKSRRALQRTIVQELKLPRWVMDVIDRQDEEDDFRGVDESSRAEIQVVGTEIHRAIQEYIYLIVFHNGSDDTIDLDDLGIPLSLWGTRVLWTFRGRLRLDSKIKERVDNSHLYLYDTYSSLGWNYLLQKVATETNAYIKVKSDKPAKVVEECYSYLLSLNSQGGNIMDYNWATHASNYWVCDGIIEEGQTDKSWEVAGALQQHIHIEDYLSNELPYFGNELKTPSKRWILGRDNPVVHLASTSFFLAAATGISDPPLRPLPNGMFHQLNKLRVLKLCHCTFSFSLPPFYCCQTLRFLALDCCKDQREEEDKKQDRPAIDFFKTLWVLDICNTDWDLDLSPEIIEQMATNIREVHINKGRFWHINFAWKKLQNLRKLRVIEPTCPWETGEKDEFTNMVKMEFLNLSGNCTIQVLPRMLGSTSIKTMILDGCVGLQHVEGLPLSLESFSLDVGTQVDNCKEAEITRVIITGCSSLSDIRLRGSFPKLEQLDLSGTKLKTLDLEAVHIPVLQRLMLFGCEQLRAVLWPKKGMPQKSSLCIDTRGGGGEVGRIIQDYEKLTKGYCQAYVAMMDMRFIHSLLTSHEDFCWNNNGFILNLEQWFDKERMGSGSRGKICRSPPLIPQHSYNTYMCIAIDDITIEHDYTSAQQFQPLGCHVQIGEGISNTRLQSQQGINAIIFVMNRAKSLHVHDNSSITTIIPEHMVTIGGKSLIWEDLKQCHVARCPKMHTVFSTNYDKYCFNNIEAFSAADLPMVHCIWTKGSTVSARDSKSFVKLQSIHLWSCPRLIFALPLSWNAPGSYFPNLETLHIINCGDMVDVFPVEPRFMTNVATDHRKGILEFPKLKNIYMHELYKLQHICEAKMFAPKLEKVWLRGCWGVRRLPSVTQDSRPIVDCEKDWWEKLEWDGLKADHDPSLFRTHHSSYYKKPLPRVSVLR